MKMRTKKFTLMIVILGLFAIHFSTVYGMKNYQKESFDAAAEINSIVEENKSLTNQQKASKYKSIYAHHDKKHGFTGFECHYYDQFTEKYKYLYSSKDIGKCIYVSRQMAKNDSTIPEDTAQLKETDYMNMDEVKRINEEAKLLSNKEKAGKYKGITYSYTDSKFVCMYRYPPKSPQKFLCRSKDFGTCVYKAQQLVKDNINISSDIAQLRKYYIGADEINRINEENKLLSKKEQANRYKSIYAHYSKKSRSFNFDCKYYDQAQHKFIYLCTYADIGKCVYTAREMAKNDPTICADVAQLKVECIDTSNKKKLNTYIDI
jgi:hypothetical protein